MAEGHMWQGEHAWQGVCMAGGMHGKGHMWQEGVHAGEKWLLKWAVRILLECILVCHEHTKGAYSHQAKTEAKAKKIRE